MCLEPLGRHLTRRDGVDGGSDRRRRRLTCRNGVVVGSYGDVGRVLTRPVVVLAA